MTITFLLFTLFAFSQENDIRKSKLIGYWKLDETTESMSVVQYKKWSSESKRGSGVRFKSDGTYIKTPITSYRRCGNGPRHKKKLGFFDVDSESGQVQLYNDSNEVIEIWKIVWADKNVLWVKPKKPNKFY